MANVILKDFPDQIKVKIGAGWKNPFLNVDPAPFILNDEITLIKCTADDFTNHDVTDDFEYWEEQISYSEDGTQTPSATNRIYMDILGYKEVGVDYSYYYKTEAVSCYDDLNIWGPVFAPCFNFDIEKEFPTGTSPDECFFTFKDIYLMESRFGITTFDYVNINSNYLDLDAYDVKNYYANCFSSMDDANAQSYLTGINKLLISLYPVQNFHKLKNGLGIQNINQLLNPFGFINQAKLLNVLSDQSINRVLIELQIDYIQNLCKLVNSFGEQGKAVIQHPMGNNEIQKLLFNLGTSVSGLQKLINTISGDSVSGIHSLINSIEEKNIVQNINKILIAMSDVQTSAIYLSTVYEIYIDGLPVKNRISKLQITMSESEVHDSFSFSSSDIRLYKQCNPASNAGNMRVEVHVGTRVFYFLLEERSGNHINFQCWGRSLTATLDNPHSIETDYSITESDTASNTVETIADDVSIVWQIDNWSLPKTFTFRGYPIEAIIDIVENAGAICRNDDAGNLIIRQKYPVRPININSAVPIIEYDTESHIIEIDVKETLGSGENCIEVQGVSEEVELPLLEVEEAPTGEYLKGQDIIVRAYWGTDNPPEITEYYTTDGMVQLLSRSKVETKEEYVTFQDGQAVTNYPVSKLKKITWIGKSGGTISSKKFSSELYITETDARIALVSYETVYHRYRLYGHNVLILIFVLVVNSRYDIAVRIKMGDADNEAPALNNPLLTNSSIAVKAGMSYLDDKKYDSTEIEFVAPYNDSAKDGIIISIIDPTLDLIGKCHVREVSIDFDGPKVTNTIKAVKFEVAP